MMPDEISLLRAAKGGLFTPNLSEAAKMAAALEERGMLKWVADGADDELGSGSFWRLSGAGLAIAYADEAA